MKSGLLLVATAAALTPGPAITRRPAAAARFSPARLLDEADTEARIASLEASVARLEATVAALTGETAEPPSGSDESGEFWEIGGTKVYKTGDGKARGVAGWVNKPAGYQKEKGIGFYAGQALYLPAGLALVGLLLGDQIGSWLESSGQIGEGFTLFSG